MILHMTVDTRPTSDLQTTKTPQRPDSHLPTHTTEEVTSLVQVAPVLKVPPQISKPAEPGAVPAERQHLQCRPAKHAVGVQSQP